MHALDRIGRRLGDQDPGTGRARERHHVHLRMRRECGADCRPLAIDEVEHALRNARGMHDFGKEEAADGRDLRGLQHHGAARRQRRTNLVRDLIQRPVPGCDHADDADRLLHDLGRPLHPREAVGLHHPHHFLEMGEPDPGLGAAGETERGAHLLADSGGDILVAAYRIQRPRPRAAPRARQRRCGRNCRKLRGRPVRRDQHRRRCRRKSG